MNVIAGYVNDGRALPVLVLVVFVVHHFGACRLAGSCCSVVAALADWLPANVQYHLRQWYCRSTLRANMAAWYARL